VKKTVLTTSALLTGAAVSVSGVVGFVGLVVPHAIRLIVGPSHRVLVPASVVTGALFMIGCDLLARTIHPPTEIRLGVVSAAVGAPFFLYWLRRVRAIRHRTSPPNQSLAGAAVVLHGS
jgi:iron complex transport system permease protein